MIKILNFGFYLFFLFFLNNCSFQNSGGFFENKIEEFERELEKKNLNTVILLNPRNEEAVYNLAKLKLEESDFSGSKKLVEKLISFCDNLCKNSKDLLKDIEKSLNK